MGDRPDQGLVLGFLEMLQLKGDVAVFLTLPKVLQQELALAVLADDEDGGIQGFLAV